VRRVGAARFAQGAHALSARLSRRCDRRLQRARRPARLALAQMTQSRTVAVRCGASMARHWSKGARCIGPHLQAAACAALRVLRRVGGRLVYRKQRRGKRRRRGVQRVGGNQGATHLSAVVPGKHSWVTAFCAFAGWRTGWRARRHTSRAGGASHAMQCLMHHTSYALAVAPADAGRSRQRWCMRFVHSFSAKRAQPRKNEPRAFAVRNVQRISAQRCATAAAAWQVGRAPSRNAMCPAEHSLQCKQQPQLAGGSPGARRECAEGGC
jgi:hypothetical protein